MNLVVLVVLLLGGGWLVHLVRRGRLREKYVGLWLTIIVGTVVLAVYPGLLELAARLLGFQLPSNLLFLVAIVLLLGVCLHLSLEVSGLEDETRVLAEEVALLTLRVGRLAEAAGGEGAGAAEAPDGEPEAGPATASDDAG